MGWGIVRVGGSGAGVYGREFRGRHTIDYSNIIYLLAYNQHMGWVETSNHTTSNKRGYWRETCVRRLSFKTRTWQDYLESNPEDSPISMESFKFPVRRPKRVENSTHRPQRRWDFEGFRNVGFERGGGLGIP